MTTDVKNLVRTCDYCQKYKRQKKSYGTLPPVIHNEHPWNTVCVDLIGPWKIPNQNRSILALTSIDPCTGYLEIGFCQINLENLLHSYLIISGSLDFLGYFNVFMTIAVNSFRSNFRHTLSEFISIEFQAYTFPPQEYFLWLCLSRITNGQTPLNENISAILPDDETCIIFVIRLLYTTS